MTIYQLRDELLAAKDKTFGVPPHLIVEALLEICERLCQIEDRHRHEDTVAMEATEWNE